MTIARPLPAWNRKGEPVRLVVLHFTAGDTLNGAWEAMDDRGVSAHYIVDHDGTVEQCVDEAYSAAHAGGGEWFGRNTVNRESIGIEIVNFGWGHVAEDGRLYRTARWIDKRTGEKRSAPVYSATGRPVVVPDYRRAWDGYAWAEYEPVQVDAVAALVREILERHGLGLYSVVGHEAIDPRDKDDPGPAFPWPVVQEACWDLWPDPGWAVRAMQSHCRRLGQVIRCDGGWGPKTGAAMRAILEDLGPLYAPGPLVVPDEYVEAQAREVLAVLQRIPS